MPPKGQKIYTYEQFRYRIRLKIGKENLQKNRYGAARHRTRNTPSEGRYSESLANLMEYVEADAFQVKERPRGYLEGSVPILCGRSVALMSCLDSASGSDFPRRRTLRSI